MTTARLIALDAMVRIEDGAYAHVVLPAMLARSGLAPRDRAFVTDLVYSSVRSQRRLDDLIGRVASRPVRRLDAPVRAALRLGAYQLLAGVPRHAAVSATVDALGARSPRARGFTNGVLRAMGALGPPWPEPERTAEALSYPDWLVERMEGELGADAAHDALRAMNEPASVTLRPNPRATTPDALQSELLDAGVTVERGRLVVVECGACPNRRLLKPVALGLPLATAVSVAGALLKCSKCGSKRVLTFPESTRDARQGRLS